MLAEAPSSPGPFAEVYEAEHEAVVRLAYLLVRSQPEAEELAQEAFLRLYQSFDSVRTPPGFLRTVVVRLAIDARRRRAREQVRVTRAAADLAHLPAEPDETWIALGRIDPRRAAVLVLRYYADLDHAAIGEVLGCSAATVRSRVRRALEDLREELAR